jgi:hypothetical protein
MESGMLVEICDENVIVGMEGGGAVSLNSPNCQLLHAANYTKEGSIFQALSTYIPLTLFPRKGSRDTPVVSFRNPRFTKII